MWIERGVWLGTAAVLSAVAYLIAVKGQRNLIAGYDASQVTDPEALGKLVAGFFVSGATVFAIIALLRLVGAIVLSHAWGAILLWSLVGTAVLMLRSRRFIRRE